MSIIYSEPRLSLSRSRANIVSSVGSYVMIILQIQLQMLFFFDILDFLNIFFECILINSFSYLN